MRNSDVPGCKTMACASCKPPPRRADLIGGRGRSRRDVGDRRRVSSIDKQVVRHVSNGDVPFIHRDDRTVLIDG